jgi:predicted metal-dependent phosphoesterase TrpH
MTSPFILNADLHCHSVVSDGTLTPETLAQRAFENGVHLWALTDHDEVGGQLRAQQAARDLGMDYLSGVEISVTWMVLALMLSTLGFWRAYAALGMVARIAPR